MPKRKVVGGYTFSDDEDDEPSPAPAPKKPYRPLMLSAPAFKLPSSSNTARGTPGPRSQPAVSSAVTARTPGQKVATPSGTHTSLPTPRDTPDTAAHASTNDSEPLSEPNERGPSTPIAHNHSKGKGREEQSGPSVQHPPAHLTYERQLHELECMAAEGAAVAAEQAKVIEYLQGRGDELHEKLETLTKDFDEYRQAQATRWAQAELVAQAAPAAPATANPWNNGSLESLMTPGIGFLFSRSDSLGHFVDIIL